MPAAAAPLPCSQYHGGVPGVQIFSFAEANWYLCEDDNAYLGGIQSWQAMAQDPALPESMYNFLSDLLTHPQGPIVWLNDSRRTNAPIFMAGRWGKGKKAHTQQKSQILYIITRIIRGGDGPSRHSRRPPRCGATDLQRLCGRSISDLHHEEGLHVQVQSKGRQ